MIPVYKPYLTKENLRFAHEALDSTWISSKGQYIKQVEHLLSSIHSVGDVNINIALTTNNGTAACHLMARLLHKTKKKIKTIIVPNNVYVAAINAFLFDKNFKLKPVECDQKTWNYNLSKLYELLNNSNVETTALLVVHNLGNIVNVPKILRDWKGLTILEDNCEGIFGSYESYPSGSLSFASALSFFGNKSITAGEGGAIIAQNHHEGYLYKLRSQGQSDTRFVHDELGYNYRMTNVQAAILYGQLKDKNEILRKKTNILNSYKKQLNIDEVSFQEAEPNTTHSKWMVGIRIDGSSYDDAEEFFKSNYIEVRPMFYPINKHSHLKNLKCHGGYSVAEKLNKECVVLPSYPELQDHEIAHIANCVKQYITKIR